VTTDLIVKKNIKPTCSNPYPVGGNSIRASGGDVLQFYGFVQLGLR
jgi:hypothetical protein